MDRPLWTPSPQRIAQANLTAFMREVRARYGAEVRDYDALHAWSVERPGDFWQAIWDYAGVIGERGEGEVVIGPDHMPGARWFPGARLNFAENLLRRRDATAALMFRGEDKVQRTLTHAELYAEVSRLAQALRAAGVAKGDRVAGYLPNMPEAVIGMLATASIGAIWSSCSPDFGVQGVLDRFGQIEPKVLLAADGYYYGGKVIDVVPRLAELMAKLPTVKHAVVVPYVKALPDLSGVARAQMLEQFTAPYASADIAFERLPFDHPLYIMYSSGTTGVPKCIVHGAGGTLLQHLKEHRLHADVKAGERLFYFTWDPLESTCRHASLSIL